MKEPIIGVIGQGFVGNAIYQGFKDYYEVLTYDKYLSEKSNSTLEVVVRHSDVSGDDVRGKGKGKTDPGSAFDWNRFQKELVA